MMTRDRYNRIGVATFVGFLWLPLLESLIGFDPMPHPQENRRLASRPAFEGSSDSIRAFPGAFEKYYDDHFGCRDTLIRSHNHVKFNYLGVTPNPEKVILGKEGWLFEGGLEDYLRRVNLFSEEDLERYVSLHEKRHAWLSDQGIRYLVVIVPEAWTLYPEYVPNHLFPVNEESRTRQVIQTLRDHSEIPCLDLTPVLREAKEDFVVYRLLDPHWNQSGAFRGYMEIARFLKTWYPTIEPFTFDDANARYFLGAGGYLNRALSLRDDLLETHHRIELKNASAENRAGPYRNRMGEIVTLPKRLTLSVFERDAPDLPAAIVFHDSFGNLLIPYLSEHFRRAVWVRTPAFNRDLVEAEKPDLVICEFAERNINIKKMRER